MSGPGQSEPLAPPGLGYRELTRHMSSIVLERNAPRSWWLAFYISAFLTLVFLGSFSYLLYIGVGIFGINIPVAWGFPIVNTIWWIGIAHAGTLISGVLLITRQPWRASINRLAEGMAMFAIVCAGLYPIMHLGRPWFMYYLLPYPNSQELWPQWRSPLVWDFFSISMYVLFTMCFLYVSMLPDFATLRDQAKGEARRLFYGVLALGWRNSAVHWRRYQRANTILSAAAVPIVVAVTGTISMDLSVSIVPGYHFTIFPPYFVCGALYSGFCTVAILSIVMRSMFGLRDLITVRHLDYLGCLMLAFVLVVDYSYIQEMFNAWYSGEDYYRYVYIDRATGPYAPVWWTMLVLNVGVAQALWSRRVRRTPALLLTLALLGDIGMWLERFQIVFTSTHADYMPSAWGTIWPTAWDWAIYGGTLGLFTLLYMLFVRVSPPLSMHDMRDFLHGRSHGG